MKTILLEHKDKYGRQKEISIGASGFRLREGPGLHVYSVGIVPEEVDEIIDAMRIAKAKVLESRGAVKK